MYCGVGGIAMWCPVPPCPEKKKRCGVHLQCKRVLLPPPQLKDFEVLNFDKPPPPPPVPVSEAVEMFSGSASLGEACLDSTECEQSDSKSKCSQASVCVCVDGYEDVSGICTNIDECTTGTPSIQELAHKAHKAKLQFLGCARDVKWLL